MWLILMFDVTHSHVCHDSFICVPWLICICVMWLILKLDVTRAYVWRDSFICVTWLVYMCDMTHSHASTGSCIRVRWLDRICDVTHSYVWHDSLTRVIHMLDTARAHLCASAEYRLFYRALLQKRPMILFMCECEHSSTRRHRPFNVCISLKWPIYMCNVTRCILGQVSRSSATYISLKWLIHTHHMTRSYVWRDPFLGVT